MCASGGGRFDAGISRRSHLTWMSDQSSPLANLSIHFGAQLLHPPEECNDWLIEWPPAASSSKQAGDLRFRLHVAMLGAFGVSAPVQLWEKADLELAASQIRWYKRHVASELSASRQYLLGDQPSLQDPTGWATAWYARRDASGGHLLSFRLDDDRRSVELPLEGLLDDSRYRVTEESIVLGTYSGRELADGISLDLPTPHSSRALSIDRVEAA
jgi:alpha-galactosidase